MLQMTANAGTTLRYRPGLILGGGGLVHDCGTARGIGYFLEPLLLLALFAGKVQPWTMAYELSNSELILRCNVKVWLGPRLRYS